MANFDKDKLAEAKELLFSLNRAYDNDLINETVKCIDFVLGMTFCKDCSRRESCWVDDDDYCSSGWAKIHKDIDDNTETLRKLLDEKCGKTQLSASEFSWLLGLYQ